MEYNNANKHTTAICRNWYERLGFPKEYDGEFERILGEYDIPDCLTIEEYNSEKETDGRKNLASVLYMCERVEKAYLDAGIPEEIMLHTLRDIVIWTKVWTGVKGELCLFEIPWLAWHLKLKLFRIGSLEYVPSRAEYDCPALSLSKGAPIVEIHIPNGADISPSAVEASLRDAAAFFEKYYPDHKYKHYTFHSWIMDENLRPLLSPTSNILKFQDMFERVPEGSSEDYAGLRYVFGWDATKEDIASRPSTSSFASRMKEYVLSGGRLYVGFGVMGK